MIDTTAFAGNASPSLSDGLPDGPARLTAQIVLQSAPSRVNDVLEDRSQKLYEKLCEWQTRVIELLPGADGDPLHCNMHVADIISMEGLGLPDERRRIQYEALSYSWGQPERTFPITCNGVPILVPPAMAEALSALRVGRTQSRWLWCDAICIHQNDPIEKSHQVQMMLTIFMKACNVIAWLGPSTAEIENAFEAIRTRPPEREEEAFRSRAWMVIQGLLGCGWFRRTWVRQEVFAARHLSLQCGAENMRFRTFIEYARSQTTLPPHVESLYAGYESGKQPRDKITGSLTHRLYRILQEGHAFGVSDPRDRVYALLGMVDGLGLEPHLPNNAVNPHHQMFPVDYTKSVSGVYQDVIKHLINETGTLECLHHLGARTLSPHLPSWVLDWENPRHCEMPFLDFALSGWDDLYGSTRKRYGRASAQNMFIADGRLRLTGRWLGTVGERFTAVSYHSFCEPPPDAKQWTGNSSTLVDLVPKSAVLRELCLSGDYECRAIRDSDGSPVFHKGFGGVVVPRAARDGYHNYEDNFDAVIMLDGSPIPFVLRPQLGRNDSGRCWAYSLVGAAWFWQGTHSPEDLFENVFRNSTIYHSFRLDAWLDNIRWKLSTSQAYRGSVGEWYWTFLRDNGYETRDLTLV